MCACPEDGKTSRIAGAKIQALAILQFAYSIALQFEEKMGRANKTTAFPVRAGSHHSSSPLFAGTQ
jgi:hypothetical protein